MQNTGTTTWTTADGYKLGSQNPQDNTTWGLNRVALPSSVAPNTQATFSFNITAPATAGTYNFQWRMLKEGVESFGAFTTNVALVVSATPSQSGTITANPNPIQVCDGSGLGVTTLSWTSTGTTLVEVRIGSPSGTLFAQTGPTGSATTGKWVTNGMTFFLQDVSGGLPLTSANTLATVTVNLTTAGCGSGDPSLMAHWKLDESSGTSAGDSSGNGNNATLVNGPVWVQGTSLSAVRFDGTDDRAAVAYNTSISNITNNFTLAFWALPQAAHEIDPENTAGIGGVSGQRYVWGPAWFDTASATAGAGVSVGTNGVSVYEHAAGYMPAPLVHQATLSTWTHVAVVYDNRQPKLYMNGVLVRTGVVSPKSTIRVLPDALGGKPGYGMYNGSLDDVRLYNRVLTAAEIQSLATQGCSVPVAPPPSSFPADTLWFDDQLPASAVTQGAWVWDTQQKASGIQSHTEPPAAQFHQHYFLNTSQTLSFGAGDKIAVYVLINPCSPPREIMLQFLDTQDPNWDHRAFWGENLIFTSVQQGPGRFPMGALPVAGQWVRLEVPASSVGLEGKTIHGMAFTLYDGQAWFDRVSKVSGSAGPNITSLSPASGVQGTTFPLTISGFGLSGTTSVNFSPSTGITVSNISSSATQVTATLSIASSAPTGARTVSVTAGGLPSNQLSFTVNAANPVPQVTSINPSTVTAGSSAFTLTVNGSSFINGSVVRVNGSNRTTTFASANQVTAAIPASDIASAGSLTITVFNPAPGGGVSNGVALTVPPPSGPCQVATLSGSGVQGYADGSPTFTQWNVPYGGVVGRDPVSGFNALFIPDASNHVIRVTLLEGPNTGFTSTIAGVGFAGYSDGEGTALDAMFNDPRGVAAITDSNGIVTTLIVADYGNHLIRKLTKPLSGNIWGCGDIAGFPGFFGSVDGVGTGAAFNLPHSVTVGTNGKVYVADSGNNAIREVDLNGNTVTLMMGSGLGVVNPTGITVSRATGVLYFTDRDGHSIFSITTAGLTTKLAGSIAGFADATGTAAMFRQPYNLAWTNAGGSEVLYIADKNNHRVRKLLLSTNAVTTLSGDGVAAFLDGACSSARFNNLRGAAIDSAGVVYVMDTGNFRIRKVTQ